MSCCSRLERLNEDRNDVRAILRAIGGGTLEGAEKAARALEQQAVSPEFEEGRRLLETVREAVYELMDLEDHLGEKLMLLRNANEQC